MSENTLRLRPVSDEDLVMFRRFVTEPGLVGLDWNGFKDPHEPARRYAVDGYLGTQNSRLMVEGESERIAAGFVSWGLRDFGGPTKHWEIGIVLLPEWRGRGIGWRA